MKKTLFKRTLSFAAAAAMASSAAYIPTILEAAGAEVSSNIEISSDNFPDWYFRRLVRDFDTDDDGELSREEIDEVLSIDTESAGITSFVGIQFFDKLEYFRSNWNYVDEIDLSGMSNLTDVQIMNGGVKSLIIDSPALTNLDVGSNQLESLDCSKLENLESLVAGGNDPLKSLDLSKNSNLHSLDIYWGGLESLNVKGCPLDSVNIRYVPLINADFTKTKGTLEYFYVDPSSITLPANCADGSVDLVGLYPGFNVDTVRDNSNASFVKGKLVDFNYDYTFLTIDASNRNNKNAAYGIYVYPNKNIHNVDNGVCADCGAIVLDENTFPDENLRDYIRRNYDGNGDGVLSPEEIENIHSIYATGCGISDLTGIEHFTELNELVVCDNRDLHEVDISMLPGITYANLGSCDITSLKIAENAELRHLCLDYNANLTNVDISNAKNLNTLQISYTSITDVDLTVCPTLTHFEANGCQLDSLNLSKSYRLETLNLVGTQIESIDLSKADSLVNLNIDGSSLESLDVSNSPMLSSIVMSNTRIRDLDVSNNPELSYIDFSDSDLQSLDLSSNYNINEIHGNRSQLSHIVFPEKYHIDYIHLDNCKLPYVDLSKVTSVYSTWLSENYAEITADYNWEVDFSAIPGFDPDKVTSVSDAELVDGKFINLGYQIGESMYRISYYYDFGNGDGRWFYMNVVKPSIITSQPESVSVFNTDSTAKFSCEADGARLTYCWYKKAPNDKEFTLLSSGKNCIVDVASSENGTQFYCVATDMYGNDAQSDTVTLNIKYVAAIKEQPKSVTVNNNNDVASATVKAEGDGLTYKWYFKNAGSDKYYESSITTNTYSVKMTYENSGRTVYCVITDKYGNSVKSDAVTLSKKKDTVKITSQPQSVTVLKAGNEAKVTVGATGDGLTYEWYRKDKDSTKFYKIDNTTNTYSVGVAAAQDGRQLYCIVSDYYGNKIKTEVVTLSIAVPVKITAQPKDAVVYTANEIATVKVAATGSDLKYEWYIKDAGAKAFSKSSITTNSYSVALTAAKSGRQVYCVVTDKYGFTAKSDVVTLTLGNKVKITSNIKNVMVNKAGDTAKVTIGATGDGLTYKWYMKTPSATSYGITSTTTASFATPVTEAKNGTRIFCMVYDKYGNKVQSDIVILTVAPAVKITSQPQSVTVAKVGDTAKVTVGAKGDGLTYKWYMKLPGSSSYACTATTTPTFATPVTAAKNGTRLFCMVYDKYGNKAQSDIVTLSTPAQKVTAKITSQPKSVTVAKAGDTAKVTVGAVGDGLTYKWYMKTPGAASYGLTATTTATYATPVTAAKDGTRLFCMVYDKYGNKVQSDIVVLTIKK